MIDGPLVEIIYPLENNKNFDDLLDKTLLKLCPHGALEELHKFFHTSVGITCFGRINYK